MACLKLCHSDRLAKHYLFICNRHHPPAAVPSATVTKSALAVHAGTLSLRLITLMTSVADAVLPVASVTVIVTSG